MKPSVYHVGLTPPPSIEIDDFQIHYFPVSDVIFKSSHMPEDIREVLKQRPIIVLMSKNSVSGLEKWLSNYNLDNNFFNGYNFWTVGERTQNYLQKVIGIQSSYPDEMTGKGLIKVLNRRNYSKVLLITGQNPQEEFIDRLSMSNIHFFHFPVYEVCAKENLEFSTSFMDSKENYLIITSPSSIDGIIKNLRISDLSEIKSHLISIGPTTSSSICRNGGIVFYESTVQNIKILYEKLINIIFETHN